MFKRIYIEITNVCNLNCTFCPSTNRKKEYMSLIKYEEILKKIKGHTKYIYLHVKGEPLMHKDIDKILKLSNKYNIKVNITTNARLLKNKLDVINSNNIRQLNISLHSFSKTDEIKELLNTIDLINKSIYVSLRLWNNSDNKDVISILEDHYNIKINSFNKILLKDNIYLDKDKLFDWPDIRKDVICNHGNCKSKMQLGILVDGTVVPCCLDNDGYNNLGNIFNNSLDEILNSDKYKNIINGFNNNVLVSELCKRCGYRTRFKG